MREIPVDVTKVTLVATGKVAARAEYVTLSDGQRRPSGAQAKSADGVPEWIVDVICDDSDSSRAEVIGVRVASHEEPVLPKWQPVRFIDLVAVPYVDHRSGRVAVSFRASGIEPKAAASKAA